MDNKMDNTAALSAFVGEIGSLGGQLNEIFKSGRVDITALEKMNGTVENIARLHKENSSLEEIAMISADLKTVYYNFNAIVSMIQSKESIFMDDVTMRAINTFLKNMNVAVVNIAAAYGLV